MAKLIDCQINYFLEKIKDKDIIAFGAGQKFRRFVSDFNLEQKILFVVDNNRDKQGTEVVVREKKIRVENISKLIQHDNSNYIVLITNLASTAEIMKQINAYKELDDTECYCAHMMLDYCMPQEIVYTKGEQIIPKKIHYCWFGGNPIPEKLQKCIDSWKVFCSDYEIIRWDESNYDVSKNVYMKQAYECKKWGFVPDYARLDILAQHGGIYLDTDVEIVKNFDDLLQDRAFMGFGTYNEIGIGLGTGAIANNELIVEMRDFYNDKQFLDENNVPNLTTCTAYQAPVLIKYGFELINRQQKINGNVLYPKEVFAPTGTQQLSTLFTEHTHSIHHCARTWESEVNNRDYVRLKEVMKEIEVIRR